MNEGAPRDKALSRALAEVEQTRAIMKTVLDNMSEAVCLYDKDHVLLFLNDMFAVMHGFAPGEIRVGMKIEDVLRLLAERRVRPVGGRRDQGARTRRDADAGRRQPVRPPPQEAPSRRVSVTPLADGGFVTVCRDITELKDREDAIALAKEEVERTRTVMQTILDNMSDGVSLYDKDYVWQFTNRIHIQRHEYPPEQLAPGVTGWDRIRYQVRRGEYGPVPEEDVERWVTEIATLIRRPSGASYAPHGERALCALHLQDARGRQPARRLPRHHRIARTRERWPPPETARSRRARRRKPPTAPSRRSSPR